mgnify:CR=1 FL=1
MTGIPDWMQGLTEEDFSFLRHFLLSSGSLKELASVYGVTYPTIRLRLDRLIQKVQMNEEGEADPFVSLLHRMTLDDRLEADTAQALLREYRRARGGMEH